MESLCRIAIPWIILTSPATDERTRQYFEQQSYFGLLKSQVHFVLQVCSLIYRGDTSLLHFTCMNKANLSFHNDNNLGIAHQLGAFVSVRRVRERQILESSRKQRARSTEIDISCIRSERDNISLQDELPCLTEDGCIILETRETAARAPNGNGGLFAALIE